VSLYDDLPLYGACHTPLTPLRFLDRAKGYFGEQVAVIAGERQWTWREVAQRATRLASALHQRGVRSGDTVSVLAPNGISIFESHFGVPMCGAVLNNLNTRLEPSTLSYILSHCEAKMLLVDIEFGELARKAVTGMARPPLLIDIVDPQGPGGVHVGAVEYEQLLAEGADVLSVGEPASELQPISLNYTSGTTGRPKGVVYDHRNAFLESIGNMLSLAAQGDVTAIWAVPIFHANGWCYLWPMAGIGARNILLRRPTGSLVLQAIADHQGTHVFGAPIIAQLLAEVPSEQRPAFSHAVRMVTAGAPPTPAHFVATEELGVQLDQGYGLTEVWGPAIFRTPDPSWSTLAPIERGRLKTRQGIPNLVLDDVRVVDPVSGEPVPRDGTTLGEVLFRGNVVMRGYLKDPHATAKAFADGYFHSGDLAVVHPDGSIELKDRSKDIIISGGENISSIEIENAICEHLSVVGAAVVGVRDEKWGEVPWAFIEIKPGATLTVEEIISHCRARLAGFKVPKGVTFGPITRTATGKVQKFLLRTSLERKATT